MRRIWFGAVVVLLTWTLALAGGAIFSQEPDDPTIGAFVSDESTVDVFGIGFDVADDFTLDEDAKIRSVVWYGGYSFGDAPEEDDFTILFFEDDGGVPAAEPFASYHVGDVNREEADLESDSTNYVYRANIPKTEFEGGTTYYIAIKNDTGGEDLWVWLQANTFEGGPVYLRFDFGGGFGDWDEDFGVEGDEAGYDYDLAFTLKTNRSSDSD